METACNHGVFVFSCNIALHAKKVIMWVGNTDLQSRECCTQFCTSKIYTCFMKFTTTINREMYIYITNILTHRPWALLFRFLQLLPGNSCYGCFSTASLRGNSWHIFTVFFVLLQVHTYCLPIISRAVFYSSFLQLCKYAKQSFQSTKHNFMSFF